MLRQKPDIFAVLGLVNNPGVFEYPPGVTYNLAEAIAFAQGLDLVSSPHYVQVYRESGDGRIVCAVFDVSAGEFGNAASVVIKPGDIIMVADTSRTLFRRVLAHLLKQLVRGGFYVTTYYNPFDH